MRRWSCIKALNKGVTVVEVVVLISLFCLVFALFFPRVSTLIKPETSAVYCLRLKESLESLIQRSASTGLPYVFVIDMDANSAWGLQTDNLPRFMGSKPLGRSMAIENMYDSVMQFGPEFKFLDVEYADTVKFENGLAPIRFDNGFNEHVLLHIEYSDMLYTLWLQPFIAQVYIFEGYFTFDNIYYQKY